MIDEIERKEAARAAAVKEAERARAERARRAAEALSEATLKADAGKQTEALIQSREVAVKSAEQSLATAEQQAEEARRALERARSDQMAAARGGDAAYRVAAVATRPAAPKPPETSTAGDDPRMLATQLQRELTRVGCDPGRIDGNWGAKGRAALSEFARLAKLALPIDEPTRVAVEAVEARRERVCRLTCDDDEVERDGKCVTKSKRSRSAAKSGDDDEDEEEKPASRSRRSTSSSGKPSSSSSSNSSSRQQSSSKTGFSGTGLVGGIIGKGLGLTFGAGKTQSQSHDSSSR
jgi:hypothetical protein